jgi:hypothetical protein
MMIEHLIAFASSVRAQRSANPGIAGDGTALELLIAPSFQSLLESVLPQLSASPIRVLPEYRIRGFGRPDIAFAMPSSPARAFIELKEPRKSIEPGTLTGHDKDQFERFGGFPLWALTNFSAISLYQRDRLVDQAQILPRHALDPNTSGADAERAVAIFRQTCCTLCRLPMGSKCRRSMYLTPYWRF